jgi:VIT1/CCC1 family predicted Fe2+/Mn2+ transporter
VRPSLARPAVFGLFDGTCSLLGVVLYLLGHQGLIFPAALSGGISSALSMAAGEWLSDGNGNGLAESAVIGAATGTGAVLPAVPYAVTTGPVAVGASVAICIAIAVVVALMRAGRSRRRALAETLAILGVIFLIVLACGLVLPGAAA